MYLLFEQFIFFKYLKPKYVKYIYLDKKNKKKNTKFVHKINVCKRIDSSTSD